VRSRISIPGGTCEFDLPSYFAWQHEPLDKRQADLQQWAAGLGPLAEAISLILGLLRDGGHPQMVAAPCGQYQQSLKEGRTFHLLRLRIDPALGLIPEISANRLLISIRLMRQDAEGKLKIAADTDAAFELTLCA
jgi:cell division protein ZapD